MFRRHHRGLPDDWTDVAARQPFWTQLADERREQIRADADWFARHKTWEAAHGFELTGEMTTVVALQAARLVEGIGRDELVDWSVTILYPTAVQSTGERAGPIDGTVSDGVVPVLGEAHDRRGPVILAWDRVVTDATTAGGGNVVLHELAHKLDMHDGYADGTPALRGRVDPDRWEAVTGSVFERLAEGHECPPLDPYGATNRAEFLAVATEAFFEHGSELAHRQPELYDALAAYYALETVGASS